MKLKNGKIINTDTWFHHAPPMGGEKQWKDGRSAKELARYMTAHLPEMPAELEWLLSHFVGLDSVFGFEAEYVTSFDDFDLGRGEGRNHDAFMWSDGIVVGIEGKADEALGSQTVGEALVKASNNKIKRMIGLSQMIFGDEPCKHSDLRYQLLTACAATLLEAEKAKVNKAVLAVLVFKKDGCFSEAKIERNNRDIRVFLSQCNASEHDGYFLIPTHYGAEHGINLYFKKIEIVL